MYTEPCFNRWLEVFISRSQFRQKVDIPNKCLGKIFHNFIPNRIKQCSYKHLPWMINVVKIKLKERSKLTKSYYTNGSRKSTLDKVDAKWNACTEIFSAAKHEIRNRFLSNKRIFPILPLLVNGSSKRSSSLAVLSSQCTSLQNSNIDLFSLNINKDDVLVITKSLSFDTFHGWDSLSFKIMKLCGKFIAYPLELIFEAFLQNRVSLSAKKKLT